RNHGRELRNTNIQVNAASRRRVFGYFFAQTRPDSTKSELLFLLPFRHPDTDHTHTMPSPGSEPASDETDHDGVESVLRSYLYHDLLQKHLSPPKELGIPSKQLWPEDWNFHFERAYLRKYGPNADLATWKRENYDFELISYIGNLRRCNQDIAASSKALLESEGALVALAIEELVDRDFEAAWMALEKGTKQCLVLEGLVHAAFKAREKSRFDCPEMSLFGLIGDGEYNDENDASD
ncbi:hypothetical protein DFH06DRAFT_1373539, partial [Mycena polygramma]